MIHQLTSAVKGELCVASAYQDLIAMEKNMREAGLQYLLLHMLFFFLKLVKMLLTTQRLRVALLILCP